jgi:LemA protein
MSVEMWIVIAAAAVLVCLGGYRVQPPGPAAQPDCHAFGQIDVQLKRRYDLVPNLVEVAKRYLAHEATTLEAVIRARSTAQGAAAVVRQQPADARAMLALANAEQTLGGSLGRLMAVAEGYPELKADGTMRSLSEELTSTENRVGFARQAYNDEVLEYNDAARSFPRRSWRACLVSHRRACCSRRKAMPSGLRRAWRSDPAVLCAGKKPACGSSSCRTPRGGRRCAWWLCSRWPSWQRCSACTPPSHCAGCC